MELSRETLSDLQFKIILNISSNKNFIDLKAIFEDDFAQRLRNSLIKWIGKKLSLSLGIGSMISDSLF